MNKPRYWNQNKDGRNNRGGFNRGRGRGMRGWPRNRGGFNDFSAGYDGFGGVNRYQKDFHPNSKHWKNRQQKRDKRDTPGKRLSEDLIGVTEYISAHEGFNGIIKSRYSDFQVSEMNEKGEIAKLTDLKPPLCPADEAIDEDEDLLLNKYNLEILPMETWDKINSLTMNSGNGSGENESVEIDMEGVSKEQRTKIHDAVKKAFGDSIVGSTVNIEDKKFMRFQKYRKGVRIDNRVKWVWPGEYVYFIVHKENCDTMDAAVRIAERIGVHLKPSNIGYAGTKDRRAKTSQWFSVKRIDPIRIANSCKHLRDIHVGNFTFGPNNLKLGMLKGNKFRIALRNVTAPEELVDSACKDLKEQGFINYYGLQRFGTRIETPTYDIGLKLLQGNFKEAIDAILEPREGPLEQVLRTYHSSGAAAAAALLPRRAAAAAHSEARLIHALADAPKDLLGALNRLARNIRLLYLHSYQSLVWNRAVSERIRRFGLKPAVGDCVPLTNVVREEESEEESDSEPEVDGEESEGKESEGKESEGKESEGKEKPEKKKPKKKKEVPKVTIPVKKLTQEDIDSGKYTLFNIVLPLPGAFVEYPPNMKDFYEETLKKDGLKLDMKHKVKSYNMCGAYRYVAVRPLNVEWSHVRYSDPFADLLASDRDELERRPITAIRDDGKYRALLLTMILPSSCYATMALRELLKVDTSSDNQALQNNYHKKNKGKKDSNAAGEKVEGEEQAGDASKSDDAPGENSEEKPEEVVAEPSEAKAVEEEKSESESGEKRKLEEEPEENAKKLKTDE